MKAYALFQQYIWLVNIIHQYGKLSLEEINNHWLKTEMSEGIILARTTFNRHRDAILDMFGIIIDCNKKDGYRYYIANEEVLEENTIQNWMLSTLSVSSILAENKGIHDRILLENIPSDGETLHKFIDAMKNGMCINVCYKRYGADEKPSTMLLEPYFVKLFNKRWYAHVKYPDSKWGLFTLAFDRILSLEITNQKFQYPNDFEPKHWFKDCYGIMNDLETPVEKVMIRAFGREANYLRDLPLHHSQREVDTTDSYTDFEMALRPTADFFTPLLSRGCAIKILYPQWIANEIKHLHQEAVKLYE